MAGASANAPQEESHPVYLQRFWRANASAFMRWFLALPYAGQLTLLRNASPDLPVEYTPVDRPESVPATQKLAPELTVKALLEENGKVLLRLMNARATRADECSRHDLVYLLSLRGAGTMPTFSGETFRHVSLAFIDPTDPEQNVQSLLPSASEALLSEKKALIAQGKLIEADVWLTLQMRQQVIYALLTNVAHTFETMFLQSVMVGEVSAAEVGCRFCGSATRQSAAEGENKDSLLRCACEAAYYCSKEHQVEDWKNHKATCKSIRKLKTEEETKTAAAAASASD